MNDLLSAYWWLNIMPMKKSGTYVSKKNDDSKFFSFFFTSPAAGKTAMGIVYLTTFVEGVEIGII